MNRRAFLSLAGVTTAALAGCTGNPGGNEPTPSATETSSGTPIPTGTEISSGTPTPTIAGPKLGDDLPSDPQPADGYPPSFDTTPAPPNVNTDSFETKSAEGQEVPLAPIDVTYRWYARGEARFADARSSGQYDRAHVYGAVSSPAPDGGDSDPVEDWPKGDRIVCYCGCPHHLSLLRAANLLSEGYEEVYVIDEGVRAWHQRNYPMVGSELAARPEPWVVEGLVSREHVGETAWARDHENDQMEAAMIAEDGSYELELHFADVTADSEIEIETPEYEVVGRLGDLAAGTVTGERV